MTKGRVERIRSRTHASAPQTRLNARIRCWSPFCILCARPFGVGRTIDVTCDLPIALDE